MNEFELFPDEGHESSSAKRPGTIQSVSIAARFLNILADAGADLPLGELARRAGTSRPTAHRYMQSLVKEGLARQHSGTGHYDLGPAALSIGLGALKRVDAVEIAARHVKELSRAHPINAGVAIWTDRGPTLVRWYRSPWFLLNPLTLGDILPVDNTACGLVFQAFLPRAEVDAGRGNQPEILRGAAPAPAVLEAVRAQHWAEMTSHLISDITGQAAPVFDAQGEIVCVITAITDLNRLQHPDDRLALRRAAALINEATGSPLRPA